MNEITNAIRKGIDSKAEIMDALKLVKNYCAYPIKQSTLTETLNADRWSHAELLYAMETNPHIKEDKGELSPVGFVCFVEANKYKAKPNYRKDIPKLLAVRFFAMQPWYDYDIAVKWVKFNIMKIMETYKQFVAVTWPVDEYDYPLQKKLQEEGFKATKTATVPVDSIFCNGIQNTSVTRIIFTLE